MDSDHESRIFFRILFDLNSVHWCSLIQTVFETLKLNSIISNAALGWFILLNWIGLEPPWRRSQPLCYAWTLWAWFLISQPGWWAAPTPGARRYLWLLERYDEAFLFLLDGEPSSWTSQALSLCSSPPVGSRSSKERRHQSPCRTWWPTWSL